MSDYQVNIIATSQGGDFRLKGPQSHEQKGFQRNKEEVLQTSRKPVESEPGPNSSTSAWDRRHMTRSSALLGEEM